MQHVNHQKNVHNLYSVYIFIMFSVVIVPKTWKILITYTYWKICIFFAPKSCSKTLGISIIKIPMVIG